MSVIAKTTAISEKSQIQKTRYFSFNLYEMPRKDKFTKTEMRSVVAWSFRRLGVWGLTVKGIFWGVKTF